MIRKKEIALGMYEIFILPYPSPSVIFREQQMGYIISWWIANFWAELDLNQRRHIANEFTVRPH